MSSDGNINGVTEKFSRSWRGTVKSSDGYSFRIAGQVGLDYRDSIGELRINSEVMAGPGIEIVVYVNSIPDSPGRPHDLVLDRLRRAAAHAGWTLDLVDPTAPKWAVSSERRNIHDEQS